MLNKINQLFTRLKYSYNEYVYVFVMKASVEQTVDKAKEELIDSIHKNNKILMGDIYVNYSDGDVCYLFSTLSKENLFVVPLLYEIYAYTTLKDSSKFSYSYKTIIFKNITVMKFKIKCYGKKQKNA